jgi:hypothetical protein
VKKFIFITPEGLTYKPNCDSPSPDSLVMQINGFDINSTVQDALMDLMELNETCKGNCSDIPFSLRVENNNKKNLWLRENRSKICTAS